MFQAPHRGTVPTTAADCLTLALLLWLKRYSAVAEARKVGGACCLPATVVGEQVLLPRCGARDEEESIWGRGFDVFSNANPSVYQLFRIRKFLIFPS